MEDDLVNIVLLQVSACATKQQEIALSSCTCTLLETLLSLHAHATRIRLLAKQMQHLIGCVASNT